MLLKYEKLIFFPTELYKLRLHMVRKVIKNADLMYVNYYNVLQIIDNDLALSHSFLFCFRLIFPNYVKLMAFHVCNADISHHFDFKPCIAHQFHYRSLKFIVAILRFIIFTWMCVARLLACLLASLFLVFFFCSCYIHFY